MIIAIDFDETLAERDDDFNPTSLLPGAKETVNWLYDMGHYIIIWTCRDGEILNKAISYLEENGVKFHEVNSNSKTDFPTSSKIYADIYIDDRSVSNFQNIDWMSIKDKLKDILIEDLMQNVEKIKTAEADYNTAPMMRGPVDSAGEQGMGESVQNMYKKRYEGDRGRRPGGEGQTQIMTQDGDWADNEAIAREMWMDAQARGGVPGVGVTDEDTLRDVGVNIEVADERLRNDEDNYSSNDPQDETNKKWDPYDGEKVKDHSEEVWPANYWGKDKTWR